MGLLMDPPRGDDKYQSIKPQRVFFMGLVMPTPPKRHVNMYGIYGFFWRDEGGGGECEVKEVDLAGAGGFCNFLYIYISNSLHTYEFTEGFSRAEFVAR